MADPAHSPSTGFFDRRKNHFHDKTKPRQRLDAAAQTAKREILTNLRDDWTWPLPASNHAVQLRINPSTQWCERFSDSSSPPPSPSHPQSPLELSNPYKFDNPDSVAQSVITRKRRRHRRLKKEMLWNEGLATYVQRRDAWTGACTSQPRHENSNHESLTDNLPSVPNTAMSPSAPTAARRSASTSPPPPLLPLCPPLIPSTNPIRASITPAAYPTIFSRVIVQGLTPNVPINLSDVVQALVQGWKEGDEWPPKAEGLEREETQETRKGSGVVSKSGRLTKKGVGKVKRVFMATERHDDGV